MPQHFRLRFDPGIKYAVPLVLLMYGGIGALFLDIHISALREGTEVPLIISLLTIPSLFLGVCALKVCFLRTSLDTDARTLRIPSYLKIIPPRFPRFSLLNGLLFPFAYQRSIPFSEIKSVLICRHSDLPTYAHMYDQDAQAKKEFLKYLLGQKLAFEGTLVPGSRIGNGASPATNMVGNFATNAVAGYAIAKMKTHYVLIIQTADELIFRSSTIFRQEDYPIFANHLKDAGVHVNGIPETVKES
jgi:hypothetical protein